LTLFSAQYRLRFQAGYFKLHYREIDNCIVVLDSHPWHQRIRRSCPSRILRTIYIWGLAGHELPAIWKTYSRLCVKYGVETKSVSLADLNTLMLWLEAGRGFTFLNASHVFRDNPRLKFIPFLPLGKTNESIIWNKNNIKPCNENFIKFVRDIPAANP
jgi:hypothetical protein